MESLNTGILKGIPILLPPPGEQRHILEHVGYVARSIHLAQTDAERETLLLREYRTRLIADVVTGKLDVREAAARLPDEPEGYEPLEETDALTEGDEGAEGDAEATPEEAEA